MTTGHVFMALSLDDFVARDDGGVDWLSKYQSGGEDHGFAAFLASVDGLVMGRASYENVLTFGEWFYTKPVVVMSRSLTDADIPEKIKDRVRLSNQTPEDLMAEARRGRLETCLCGRREDCSVVSLGEPHRRFDPYLCTDPAGRRNSFVWSPGGRH